MAQPAGTQRKQENLEKIFIFKNNNFDYNKALYK